VDEDVAAAHFLQENQFGAAGDSRAGARVPALSIPQGSARYILFEFRQTNSANLLVTQSGRELPVDNRTV
jgi:hypothetical protein